MSEDLGGLNLSICEETPKRVVLFSGDLYSKLNYDKVKQKLLHINSEIDLQTFLKDLSGIFSGLIYLKDKDQVFAFVDQFGVKKIFYSIDRKHLIISSHLSLMSQACMHSNFSMFAFGSIIYCGHIFCDSVLHGISQVNAACYVTIQCGQVNETEYVTYPEIKQESFNDAVARVRFAHLDFWKRMQPIVSD